MLYGMFLRMLHGEEQLNEDVLEKITFVSLWFLLCCQQNALLNGIFFLFSQ